MMKTVGGKNLDMEKLKSEKTNSEIGLAYKETGRNFQTLRSDFSETNRFATPKATVKKQTLGRSPFTLTKSSSMKKTVTYKDVPWNVIPLDQKYDDPFSKQSMQRTASALGIKRGDTMASIMLRSHEINSNLKEMLKSQRNPTFLKERGLY